MTPEEEAALDDLLPRVLRGEPLTEAEWKTYHLLFRRHGAQTTPKSAPGPAGALEKKEPPP